MIIGEGGALWTQGQNGTMIVFDDTVLPSGST